MSDPLRTDGSRALDAESEADRDAKIEQLLLLGLDQYFAGQYDQAVNVWTRALFFDRGHARARAYIERARSALAERQRQSEELLQTGLAAFHRGDSDEARRLLQAAIDAGAPSDEALALLQRLNRLETGNAGKRGKGDRSPRPSAENDDEQAATSAFGWSMTLAAALIVVFAGAAGVAYWSPVDWRSLMALSRVPPAPAAGPVSREPALPLPRRGEMALGHATELAAGGHLRDALAVLDTIRLTDAQRAAADRLRADIQRQLIALAPKLPPSVPAPPHETAGRRLP